MYSADINRLREAVSLNSVQRQIIVGTLLGDGYLYPTVSGKYAYLRIAHGPKQEEYVWWKYQFFENWVLSPPKYQLQNKVRPELGGYYWFKTIAHQQLLRYRRIFYKDREKIIPSNIGQLLISPLSLAVWYMDDGTLAKKALHLNTQGFSRGENIQLQSVLRQNFGINSRLNKSGNIGKGYILYIPVNETKKFLSIIDPYIRDCLPYKTFLTP